MPHTITTATTTTRSRTGRPTSTTAAPARRVDPTASTPSLLHGMALLFAPSKYNEQP